MKAFQMLVSLKDSVLIPASIFLPPPDVQRTASRCHQLSRHLRPPVGQAGRGHRHGGRVLRDHADQDGDGVRGSPLGSDPHRCLLLLPHRPLLHRRLRDGHRHHLPLLLRGQRQK